jgi:anthranilate synthase component II
MKILVIDNYDSFVYNLVHQLRRLGVTTIDVVKNDRVSLSEVAAYDKILLSPGPGLPSDAGLMPRVIERYAATHSILGVCLGHQSIAEAFGAHLYNLPTPLHGITATTLITTPDYLFRGIESSLQTGHYHSWVVEEPLPAAWK